MVSNCGKCHVFWILFVTTTQIRNRSHMLSGGASPLPSSLVALLNHSSAPRSSVARNPPSAWLDLPTRVQALLYSGLSLLKPPQTWLLSTEVGISLTKNVLKPWPLCVTAVGAISRSTYAKLNSRTWTTRSIDK